MSLKTEIMQALNAIEVDELVIVVRVEETHLLFHTKDMAAESTPLMEAIASELSAILKSVCKQ
jgi:hypothetical protein